VRRELQCDQVSTISSIRNTKSVASRGSEKYKVAGSYGHKIMQKTGIISYERRTSAERGNTARKPKNKIDPQLLKDAKNSIDKVLEGARQK